jgi:chromosome segregation ATPase
MNEKIPVLHCKLKKYERKSKQKSKEGKEQVSRRYMIPVKKDQIEGTKFQEVEDIIILSKEDFEYELQKSKVMNISHEKLKQSLNAKELKIRDLNEQINQGNVNDDNLEDLENNLTNKFRSKLDNIVYEYETEIKTLTNKINEFDGINQDYNNLKKHNNELERELKRLRDLRTLENESFKIKIQEIELNSDEYDKLKKSHELLWDVVQEKDKVIKDLEKRGLVNNLFKKIRK